MGRHLSKKENTVSGDHVEFFEDRAYTVIVNDLTMME